MQVPPMDDVSNCRLMAYHEPYSDMKNNNHAEREHRTMVISRGRGPVAALWMEALNNSAILITISLLVVSQFTVILAITAVAEGSGEFMLF